MIGISKSSTDAHRSQIAWINLSTRTVHLQPPDADLEHLFIGGRGLEAALLFRHLADPANPLASENPLIFAVGPLTSTPLR